jgi:HAMP domain-containing protein
LLSGNSTLTKNHGDRLSAARSLNSSFSYTTSRDAIETINSLKDKYPDFTYKEATINPTNPRDKAVDWEVDLVQQFKANPAVTELSGERDTPNGRSLYLARPIQVKSESCLPCHTTPDAAPKAMVALYGEANGFGWKLGDVVGAQIMSVPMSVPVKNAEATFINFIAWLIGVFVVLLIVLNLTLDSLVLRPMAKLAQLADRVSTGDFQVPEFEAKGSGSLYMLTQSFNRMRRSLEKAMKLIES